MFHGPFQWQFSSQHGRLFPSGPAIEHLSAALPFNGLTRLGRPTRVSFPFN